LKSLALILFAALCWGAIPLLEKIGLKNAAPMPAVMCRTWAVAISLIFAASLTGGWRGLAQLDVRTILIFALTGILGALVGQLAYFYALKDGEASRIVPIGATYPLVAAILGMLFLKEPVSLPKIVGAILIVCGVVLVKS